MKLANFALVLILGLTPVEPVFEAKDRAHALVAHEVRMTTGATYYLAMDGKWMDGDGGSPDPATEAFLNLWAQADALRMRDRIRAMTILDLLDSRTEGGFE